MEVLRMERAERAFFTVDQISTILNLSTQTILRWIKKGIIKAIKGPGRNGQYRVSLKEVARLRASKAIDEDV
jgi:excisionase family DNA binding protein